MLPSRSRARGRPEGGAGRAPKPAFGRLAEDDQAPGGRCRGSSGGRKSPGSRRRSCCCGPSVGQLTHTPALSPGLPGVAPPGPAGPGLAGRQVQEGGPRLVGLGSRERNSRGRGLHQNQMPPTKHQPPRPPHRPPNRTSLRLAAVLRRLVLRPVRPPGRATWSSGGPRPGWAQGGWVSRREPTETVSGRATSRPPNQHPPPRPHPPPPGNLHLIATAPGRQVELPGGLGQGEGWQRGRALRRGVPGPVPGVPGAEGVPRRGGEEG